MDSLDRTEAAQRFYSQQCLCSYLHCSELAKNIFVNSTVESLLSMVTISYPSNFDYGKLQLEHHITSYFTGKKQTTRNVTKLRTLSWFWRL